MRVPIITTIALTLLIGGAFYTAAQKDTEILIVGVTLARPPDDDSARIISQVNASLSYSRRMELPQDTILSTPGITVVVIQNMRMKSGYYSVPVPATGSIYGSYNISVMLSEKIDRTKPIRILTRVVNPAGEDVSVKATDIRLS